MSPGSRKRKYRGHQSHSTQVKFPSQYESPSRPYDQSEMLDKSVTQPDPLHALYIQAYEADIIRGPHAQAAAQSLEIVEYTTVGEEVNIIPKIGSALIRWGGDTTASKHYRDDAEDDDVLLPLSAMQEESPIWVDRYDARLLLEPGTLTKPKSFEPDSPTGWSDLPSDTEDTFFFTPDETEDYRREKRRRLMEQTREERLKARMEEDHVEDEEDEEDEDVWGGSDEEPDDPQQELMRRTATHLLSSPNAAQLEMRILANYGSDKRFAFLRGRWRRRWNLIKVKARLGVTKEKDQTGKESHQAGLGLVTGYGSDDSDGGSSDVEEGASKDKDVVATTAHTSPPAELPDSTTAAEETAKEARRKRAKEWAEKRREMKFKDDTTI